MQTVRGLKECLAAAVLALLAVAAGAAPRTVCTITVNSPDEKESFRRHLGSENYRFVELVERGRADWLDSSCRAGVACDILVISAHYDGGNEFFPDSLDAREFLPVSELERVSCSGSCPALFSRLQEVYLFGCNTLNPEPHSGATAEVVRSLVREGVPKEQAERELKSLTAAQGESSRDRMRQVFDGVPTIYGFSSTAPVGPIASRVLDRYFQQAGDRDIGRGRTSSRLLSAFTPFGLTAVSGLTPADPNWATRLDMCQFADERRRLRGHVIDELVQHRLDDRTIDVLVVAPADRVDVHACRPLAPRAADPALGQLAHLRLAQAAAGSDAGEEGGIGCIEQRLTTRELGRRIAARHRPHPGMRGGFALLVADTEGLQGRAEIELAADHPDRASERGGLGQDRIGARGQPVGAAAGKAGHGDDHPLALGLRLAHGTMDGLGRGRAAAGAVEPQDDRPDALLIGETLDPGRDRGGPLERAAEQAGTLAAAAGELALDLH